MKIKILQILTIGLFTLMPFSQPVHAQDYSQNQPVQRYYKATVKNIKTENETQLAELRIENGDKKDKLIYAPLNQFENTNKIEYKSGDKVILLEITDPGTQETSYYITDFDRTNSLVWLFVLFCAVVIFVSKKWGVLSIIGMAYSFTVIFKFILPQLLQGHNPLFIAIVGSLFIAPVTFYLSHGINKKTTVALISTLISLFITGVLSMIFINAAKLTGFGSDEAFFLQIAKSGVINIKGIFLAGIIIGTLGILDDVTISQSSIVFQLKRSVRGIGSWDLYKKAMEIGHDHIASTVNTLILVYTGAALPLLLLFINSTSTFNTAINAEIIADEIIRTLVSSIGLVLAVPISTALAVLFANKIEYENSKTYEHSH